MLDISVFEYNSPDFCKACKYARDTLYNVSVAQGHIGITFVFANLFHNHVDVYG